MSSLHATRKLIMLVCRIFVSTGSTVKAEPHHVEMALVMHSAAGLSFAALSAPWSSRTLPLEMILVARIGSVDVR